MGQQDQLSTLGEGVGQLAELFDRVRELSEPRNISEAVNLTDFDDASPALMALPIGVRVEDVTADLRAAQQYMAPHRRKGTARLQTLKSLIDWADRFKGAGESAVLFLNKGDAPSLTAISNYHLEAGDSVEFGKDAGARHGDHRGVYAFPVAREFQDWKAKDGATLGKDDLGNFLDARALDLINPSPYLLTGKGSGEEWEAPLREMGERLGGTFGSSLDLLQMSRSFAVHETTTFKREIDRNTGEELILFETEQTARDGFKVKPPSLFLIAIPIFENGPLYRLCVRLTFIIRGGNLRFTMTVMELQKAFDLAVTEAGEKAAEETNLPLLIGMPED